MTAAAVRWYLDTFHSGKGADQVDYFAVNGKGKPIFGKTVGGIQKNEVAQDWHRLNQRIKKDIPGWRCLSFGKLRKTAFDRIKELAGAHGGYIYSIFSCHVTAQRQSADEHVDRYTNVKFAETFRYSDQMGAGWADVFSSVADPFPVGQRRKPNTILPAATIEKIKRMRSQGFSYEAVRRETGVSAETIRKYTAVPRKKRD